jgi:flagellar basal-body rod protein FlgF
MNYGLQMAASGVLTSLYRQDVLTNNLANGTTVGFKPDFPSTRPRDAARIEDDLPLMPSNALLERLGAGVLLNPNRVSFEQGSLNVTNAPLDVAIQGDGFFVVRDETDSSSDRVRLTRDGRFMTDAQGRMVMSTTGMAIMDSGNRPIYLNGSGPVTISADGTVKQGNDTVGHIYIAGVARKEDLTKLGNSLFQAPASALAGRRTATGTLQQGALESAAVDEVSAIMQITAASRAVESNIGMAQYADRMMDRAINSLGRVS